MRLRTAVRWMAGGVAVALIALGTYGYLSYQWLEDQIQDDDLDLHPPADSSAEPFNALLVGSDSRAGLSEADQKRLGADDVTVTGQRITGERADTLIVVHVDPDDDAIVVVQFPRDLYVHRSDGSKSKINEALLDGRPELVATVEALTHLEITRYAQVNLAGFRDIVDAVGGVEVCIPEPIPYDSATGFVLPPEEVGMVRFDGERALRYIRSRKVFAEGDFARIVNQQRFLAAALDKVTSPRTIIDIPLLERLKDAAGRNVVVDRDTSPLDLLELVNRIRATGDPRYEAYIVPNKGPALTELADGPPLSIVRPDYTEMRRMFDALARNVSPGSEGFDSVDLHSEHQMPDVCREDVS